MTTGAIQAKKTGQVNRYIELILLFILLPASLLLNYPTPIKVGLCIGAFIFSLWIVIKEKPVHRSTLWSISTWSFWKGLLLRLAFGMIAAYVIMYFYKPDMIFVIFKDLRLFFAIVFIYSFLSVTAQELAYRTFFFHRYEHLFKNKQVFMLLNAAVFSLAHIIFKDPVVLLMTFAGGLFFAYTYDKSRSLLLVCIEHAIYGLWLFMLGIGDLLAFPMPT